MNRRISGLIAAVVFAAAGCGADGSSSPDIGPDLACDAERGATGSIQRAVDRAVPGDIIEIPAGVYHESVVVTRDDITIRGTDRNTVILDGCDGKYANGILVYGNRVTVENLTVRNYTASGVMFNGLSDADDVTPLDGFAMRYITAIDNGMYGLYAFQSTNGIITDSYTAGHADSGVYVGQCSPCNTLVTNHIGEHNAVGYEGTNGSQVWVVNSVWSNNRIGMTPNTQSLERLAPQQGSFIGGNIVADNNSTQAPEQPSGGFGVGIAVGGGNTNEIVNNLVVGNEQVGIAVTDMDGYDPTGNTVTGNTSTGNGIDLAYWLGTGDTAVNGNRFSDNTFDTSSPERIEQVMDGDQVDAGIVRLMPGPAATGGYTLPTDLEPMPDGIDPIELPYTGPFPTADDVEVPSL